MKPMRKLVWMLCASLLLSAQALLAQTREITGKVTDSKDGSALSGATIYVQGTNRTTKSSPDGSFSVTAPTTAKTLLISFIGYKNQVINIGSGNVLVKMEQDVSVAEDVVVTGYKNRSKREFAGSAGTVKGDAIRATPIASFDQALQGQTPGLILRATSGQPGNSGSAIIRGRGSING
ncbi:MAG: TonB-dependent receptor plug domain-containing protein, partial [Chitinophagaceae bacterium]|nr:TonB-dependent receptor plug domain-containing protein [Chitinophagaceae bacterium]